MANCEALKASLDKNGDVVIILVDTGEVIQLPNYNVRFEDSTQEIVVDARTKTYWIGGDRVSYFWIHKQFIEKGTEE
jgi:hypothetical protein